jgi:hypothetical protein
MDLLANTLRAIVRCMGLAAKLIDDLVAGCVTQAGEKAATPARMAALTGAASPCASETGALTGSALGWDRRRRSTSDGPTFARVSSDRPALISVQH